MDEGGRLLERLQQPVRTLVVEGVSALDHEHPACGLEGCPACGSDHRAVDVRHEHLVGAARPDPGQIRVRPGAHPRARALGVWRPFRQQLGCQRSSRAALAGAGRAVEQIGVGQATAGRERRSDHGTRVGMAVELGEHGSDASDPGGTCRGASSSAIVADTCVDG